MPSYNTWNGVKCSASKRLLTEILKQELGFEGFLISDYNAIDQITPDYKEAIRISIDAGMDMAMVPTRYREFFTDVKSLVQEGKLPMSRIDDAVTRILRVKFAMGMMSDKRSLTADRKLQKSFGSAEHRKIARQAVRESRGAAEERQPRAAALEESGAHPCRRQERRRYRQSVRRLDDRLAGKERASDFGRDDHFGGDSGGGRRGHASHHVARTARAPRARTSPSP